MGNAALVVEAQSGREVWRQTWKTDWDVNAAMPIFHDGHLFLSSGYKTGCGLFKLIPSGEESWQCRSSTPPPVWKIR
jgi:hypothetical protein